MNIVILDGHALNPGDLSWKCFEPFGTVTYYDRTELESDTISRIADADIILLNKTPITAHVIESSPKLKLICVLATGYNVVDCNAAAERNIPVCNVPGYSTASVAQFTFALLLELCHHVGLHADSVHNGDWSAHPDFCYWKTPQMELAGKTIGIIGYGSIGQAVGAIAKSFGMNVLAYSRTRYPEHAGIYTDLNTLLSKADVISLHCPLFPETAEMINAVTISKMKDGVIIINNRMSQPLCAPGSLVPLRWMLSLVSLFPGKTRCSPLPTASSRPIWHGHPLKAGKEFWISRYKISAVSWMVDL